MTELELQKLKQDYDELVKVYKEIGELNIRIFPKELLDKLEWSLLDYTKFSEDFIRDYDDKVDWTRVSCDMKLSSDFIRDYADKLDWYLVSYYQVLTDDLVDEFEDRIEWIPFSSPTSSTTLFLEENKNRS